MMQPARFMLDLRVAWRSLHRARGFSSTVLILLSLSIGGVTAIFSTVDSVLFRPLYGITSQERLAWVSSARKMDTRPAGVAFPDLADLRASSHGILEQLSAYDAVAIGLATGGEPVRVLGHIVTADYFRALGTVPALGRFFHEEESQPHAGLAVAVLGHTLWEHRFGSDSTIVGRNIVLNGTSFVVIGVAPPRFTGPELGAAAQVWLPIGAARHVRPNLELAVERRDRFIFRVFGRLSAVSAMGAAETAVGVVAARLAMDHPSSHRDVTLRIHPFRGGATPDVVGETIGMATLVSVVGVLVLMISCFNVANLVLARAMRRSHECGVRLALGASRWQLIRYLMAENVLLAALGGITGVGLAWLTIGVLAATVPELSILDLKVSTNVLGLALGATTLSVLAFGVAPAVHQVRVAEAGSVLGEQGRSMSAGRGRTRLQSAFIVAQLAVSLVLLASAGQVIGVLRQAAAAELGFAPSPVTTVAFDPTLTGYGPERRAILNDAVQEQLSQLPNVASVALADAAPLSGIVIHDEVTPEGAPTGASTTVAISSIAGDYFGVLGMRIVRGRPFNSDDRTGSPRVAIVNATAARRFWPNENPLGRRLRFDGSDESAEVVGVAGDAKYDDPLEATPPFVYLPMAQRVTVPSTTVLVRSAGPPLVPRKLKEAIQTFEPSLALFDERALTSVVAERLNREQATARMLMLAGAASLLIAAVGLSGVVSYTVAQRTREIGIRQALGATPGSVVRLVMRRGLGLAALGAGIGGMLAFPVGVALNSAVFGAPRLDVASLIVSGAALIVVAAAATYLPARRASRITPTEAFRQW